MNSSPLQKALQMEKTVGWFCNAEERGPNPALKGFSQGTCFVPIDLARTVYAIRRSQERKILFALHPMLMRKRTQDRRTNLLKTDRYILYKSAFGMSITFCNSNVMLILLAI